MVFSVDSVVYSLMLVLFFVLVWQLVSLFKKYASKNQKISKSKMNYLMAALGTITAVIILFSVSLQVISLLTTELIPNPTYRLNTSIISTLLLGIVLTHKKKIASNVAKSKKKK